MVPENTYPGDNGYLLVQGSSQNWQHSKAEVPSNDLMSSSTWAKFHNTETHSPLRGLCDPGPFYTDGLTSIPAWISDHMKCGMKLLIHSQTSTVAPLKFGKRQVISSHVL